MGLPARRMEWPRFAYEWGDVVEQEEQEEEQEMGEGEMGEGEAQQEQRSRPRTNEERLRLLDKRKHELQDLIVEAESKGQDIDAMLAEWQALLEAQNRIITENLRHANLEMKHDAMSDLFILLRDIVKSKVEFSPEEAILKQSIHKTLREVDHYLSVNNARDRIAAREQKQSQHDNICDTAEQPQQPPVTAPAPAPAAPPPPPPPPPPPLIAPAPLLKGAGHENAEAEPDGSGGAKSLAQQLAEATAKQTAPADTSAPLRPTGKRQVPRTPLRDVNRPFLSDIAQTGKSVLKKTNLPRSPGGTPCRRKRAPSTLDGHDLIALALRNKFKSVTHSPLSERSTTSNFGSPSSSVGVTSQPLTPL